ncbi:MAG: hypothetical protein RIC12_01635 [Pirellulales bacterium]
MGAGYWISPSKEPIRISEHEDAVRANPEKFGLERQQLPKRGSGSREKILLAVMQQGWMRIRQYTGNGGNWTIEFVDQNQPMADWLLDILDIGQKIEIHPYESLRIHPMDNARHMTCDPPDISFRELIRGLESTNRGELELAFGELRTSRQEQQVRVARLAAAAEYVQRGISR